MTKLEKLYKELRENGYVEVPNVVSFYRFAHRYGLGVTIDSKTKIATLKYDMELHKEEKPKSTVLRGKFEELMSKGKVAVTNANNFYSYCRSHNVSITIKDGWAYLKQPTASTLLRDAFQNPRFAVELGDVSERDVRYLAKRYGIPIIIQNNMVKITVPEQHNGKIPKRWLENIE